MKRTFSQANAPPPAPPELAQQQHQHQQHTAAPLDGKILVVHAGEEMPHTLAFEDVEEICVEGACVWTPHLPHKLRRLTIHDSCVPATLPSLRKLTALSCHSCSELREIPPMELTALNCSHNPRLRSVKARARVIDCSYCTISELPVFGPELERLDASWNSLNSGISGQLWGLTHLNLSGNDLGAIDFGGMPCLEEAVVSMCGLARITGAPSRKLVADKNHLESLPPEVGHLRHLDVSHNLLARLPELPMALAIFASHNLLTTLDTCAASTVIAPHNAIRRIYMRQGLARLDVRDNPWRFALSYPATLAVLKSEAAIPFGRTMAGFLFSLEVMRESGRLPDDFLRSVLHCLQSEA